MLMPLDAVARIRSLAIVIVYVSGASESEHEAAARVGVRRPRPATDCRPSLSRPRSVRRSCVSATVPVRLPVVPAMTGDHPASETIANNRQPAS